MSAHTPEIYRRFATPLTLDLGPTADSVAAIHTITQAIRAQTDQLPQLAAAVAEAGRSADQALTAAREEIRQDFVTTRTQGDTAQRAIVGGLTSLGSAINQHTATVVTENRIALETALGTALGQATQQILNGLTDLAPSPLHASAHAWPLLRVLVQAMTQVLDQTPDEIHSGKDAQHKGRLKNDVTLEQLRDSIDPADLNRLDTAPGHLRARFLQAFDRLHTADQNRRAERLDTLHVLMGEVARHLK